jgi:RNA polymerase sigma-70 factor (ECF subfamily)
VTIPSAPGELVLDGVCGWSPVSVIDMAGDDQIARWHWSTESLSSAGSEKPGAPGVTLTWTSTIPGTMEWAAAGVSLRPSGVPVSVDLRAQTAGCGVASTWESSRSCWFFLGICVVWAARRRTGTFGGAGRETREGMRLISSRPAPPPEAAPDLDEITLARAKAGDRAAQAAIVHRYERPVFSLLWRMVGPQRALVEDLTQETFLRVLRSLTRFEYDGRARMITWVLSIASRLAIDHLRACKPRTDASIVPGALPTALPRPDHEANRRALAVALVHAVETLGPQFRAAFQLREVHGLSYDEISLALEIDVGTVKSRLARARAALQAALAEMRDE